VIEFDADPAEAVLAAARERDADLIVVGVQRKTWLDCLLQPSMASHIVANARRSVLLTPIANRHDVLD
jgi:nucleotide-binding universal stress UspA family protein